MNEVIEVEFTKGRNIIAVTWFQTPAEMLDYLHYYQGKASIHVRIRQTDRD